MKKIFTLVCALMLGIGVSQAQVGQGETAVGVNLVYGSEIESLGLGARFQYGIIDHLRGEVGFNYFFDAHYLVNLFNENFFIYPLAGLNYTMAKFEGVEKNHIGLNLGAGVEYEISDHWGVNLEYRHTIIRKVDQGVIGLGLNYKF